jgi:membrane protein
MKSMSGPREKAGILLQASKKFYRDHGFLLSSGITFNFLICMIPLTLLLLSLASPYLYTSREILKFIGSHLHNVIPSLDPETVRNVMRIIGRRRIVGFLSFAGLIWSSTLVFSSLRSVFDIVFQVERGHSILRGKAVDLLLLLLVGISFLASMGLNSAVALAQHSPVLNLGRIAQFTLRYVIPFLLSCLTFFLLYKLLPKKRIHAGSSLQAALFAGLLGEGARHIFAWYVVRIARFSMVYGSLSALAVFFLFVYYSSAILILGIEFVFVLEGRNAQRRPQKR